MIKLLGLDMDGTVLNSEVEVSEENKKAIKEAIEKGVIVVPTSGRALSMIPREILNMPGIDFAITSNGAAIFDTNTKEVIYEQPIPKDEVKKIFDILDKYDTFDEIVIDGRSYTPEEHYKQIPRFVEDMYLDLYTDLVTPISNEVLREEINKHGVEKISFRLPLNDESKKDEIFAQLEELPGLMLLAQAEGTKEITNYDANKGEALAAIANRFGLDCSEVMVLGDSENDISMLTFAGTGIAMGQAKDHVKEHADFITATNDENGVAKAIDKFILNAPDDNTIYPVEMVEKLQRVCGGR